MGQGGTRPSRAAGRGGVEREREGGEWEGGLGAKRGRWALFPFPCFLLSFFYILLILFYLLSKLERKLKTIIIHFKCMQQAKIKYVFHGGVTSHDFIRVFVIDESKTDPSITLK
jgi:hypothetical protein